MLESRNFRLFLWLSGGLLLTNLFAMNGITTIWSGAETELVSKVVQKQFSYALPIWGIGIINSFSGFDPFLLRFSGPIFFTLTLICCWIWGQKIFGRQTAVFSILLISASFVLPNIAKLAVGDTWLLCAQFIAFLMVILYLKQPVIGWRLGFYLAGVVSILIHPLSSVIFLLTLVSLLYFFHPKGKSLWKLNPWIMVIASSVLFYLLGWRDWRSEGFVLDYFGLSWGKYLIANLLGVLPWLGFVIAGVIDSLKKRLKGEEFGLIMLTCFFSALLSQSPVLGMILAIWGGKHLGDYFIKNYPYRNIIKTVSILNLVLAFCLASFLMMRGFFEFKGLGFQAGLFFSFAYWVPTFIAIVGLYGPKKRLVISGMVLTGLLASFVFWYQINPLLESRRNLPKRLVQTIQEQNLLESSPIYFTPVLKAADNLKLYLDVSDSKINWISPAQYAERVAKKLPNEVFIIEDHISVDSSLNKITLEGWNDQLKVKKMHLIIQ